MFGIVIALISVCMSRALACEYSTARISLYASVHFPSVDTAAGYAWNVRVSTPSSFRLTFSTRSSFSVRKSIFLWCSVCRSAFGFPE